jgi:hypothetical protein
MILKLGLGRWLAATEKWNEATINRSDMGQVFALGLPPPSASPRSRPSGRACSLGRSGFDRMAHKVHDTKLHRAILRGISACYTHRIVWRRTSTVGTS